MSRTYPTTSMCDGDFLAMFEPTAQDTDVFVSTAAKCGQTWLQTLLFHLRTRGEQPDFGGKGLMAHSPWLELPGDSGFSEPTDRPTRLARFEAIEDPRIFKLHVTWNEIPRPDGCKAKIMTITRDPRDVPYSMFAHLHSMHFDPEPPASFDEYFERWLEFGYYFQVVKSFWPHRDDSDVLWLRFEDMKTELRRQTERIVEFLGWDVSSDVIDRVLPLVDFEHMQKSEIEEIFGGRRRRWKEGKRFFREGGIGKNRMRLSPEQEQRILDRAHAELDDELCAFLLTLPDRGDD